MNNQENRLGIAIPTKNRDSLLNITISSIIESVRQINAQERVLIVISDNNSSDKTTNVVTRLSAQHRDIHFIYRKQPNDLDHDHNIAQVLKIAAGSGVDYVFTCGDDDIWEKDATSKILWAILRNPGFIHANFSRFSHTTGQCIDNRSVTKPQKSLFILGSEKTLNFPFGLGSLHRTMEANAMNLSTIGLRADLIREYLQEIPTKYWGLNIIHSFLFTKTLRQDRTAFFIADPIIKYRVNPDSRWSNNVWQAANHDLQEWKALLGYSQLGIQMIKMIQAPYESKPYFMGESFRSSERELFTWFYNCAVYNLWIKNKSE